MLLVLVGGFNCFSLAKDSLLGWEETIGILLNRIEALKAAWGDIRAIEASLRLDSVVDLTTKH